MKLHIVRCPHCGYEYSASEVVVQSSLLERPYFIKRDAEGHVVGALGKEGSLTDIYKCDACDEMFKIDVDLSFTLSKVEKFSEISSVSLV